MKLYKITKIKTAKKIMLVLADCNPAIHEQRLSASAVGACKPAIYEQRLSGGNLRTSS